MKAALNGILLFLTAHVCLAQQATVTGRITDDATGEPLPYASIYINYSTKGATADASGNYILEAIDFGEYEFVISFVAHKTEVRKLQVQSKNIELNVKLSTQPFRTVEVSATRDELWRKHLRKFSKIFLGGGREASLAKINNQWVLDFSDNKTAGVFTAQASSTLNIDNYYLGYKLHYDLTRFYTDRINFNIAGNVRFEEFTTPDSVLGNKWMENRKSAYRGSTLQFFKALIERRTSIEGFRVYRDHSYPTPVRRSSDFRENLNMVLTSYKADSIEITQEGEGIYRARIPERIEVHYIHESSPTPVYSGEPYAVSWIEVKEGILRIDKNGKLLNANDVFFQGTMGEERIAQLLPLDYRPPAPLPIRQDTVRLNPLLFTIEKPYVHTDRAYYYPNETIWMKVYMHYAMPSLQDSLSHLLHIDLVREDGHTIQSETLKIEDGRATSQIHLPADVVSGNYVLRAYTNWMLNFGKEFIFETPLKILTPDQALAFDPTKYALKFSGIQITTDKKEYAPRERVRLTIEARDFMDQLVKADVSVAVTDIGQVVPVKSTDILTSFFPRNVNDSIFTKKKIVHSVERGFVLKGAFTTRKGKPAQGLITVYQKDTDVAFRFITDKAGQFSVPNLQFGNNSIFYFDAVTSEQGRPGLLTFDTARTTLPLSSVPALEVSIINADNYRHRHEFPMSRTKMLKEVVVQSKRIEQRHEKISSADVSVAGEILREANFTDVLEALRAFVPGLKILYVTSHDGQIIRILNMGGPSTFGGMSNSEPLILVDGISVNGEPGDAANFVSALAPSQINRIEVIKFGGGAAYGARGGNGVILVYTSNGPRENNFDFLSLPHVRLRGFANSDSFPAPVYDGESELVIPDFRATIHWEPSLQLDGQQPASLEFFTSGLPGTYRVVVEGVTDRNKPIRGELLFVVRE